MSENNQGPPGTSGGGGAAPPPSVNNSFRPHSRDGFYRGGGFRRGGGRGHGRGRGTPNSTTSASSSKGTKFEGRIPGLEKHVYEYITPTQAAEAFRDTTKEIGQYISTNYTGGVDVSDIINQRKMIKVAEPSNLSDEDKKSDAKVEIWKKMCGNYVQRVCKRE
jgi:hypothetical protein